MNTISGAKLKLQFAVQTRAGTLYNSYCLLLSTFPMPLFHTQMRLVFEVLYLTQILMDYLKSWTAHSPICTLDV